MGKDRYSDDHTIEVVEGTKTLVISENATVVVDLDVGNNLTVAGDLSVSGSVSGLNATSSVMENITGVSTISSDDSIDITADQVTITATTSVEIDSPLIKFTSIPELDAVDTRYISYPASSFIFQKVDAGTIPELEEYGRYWLLNDANDPQIFFCPVNNIPQGSQITQIFAYYKTEHANDNISLYFYSLDLSDISGAGDIGDVGFTTYYGQSLPTDGLGWTSDSVTQNSIPTIDYSDKSYYIRFSGECGSASTEIALASVRIRYTTKSVGL